MDIRCCAIPSYDPPGCVAKRVRLHQKPAIVALHPAHALLLPQRRTTAKRRLEAHEGALAIIGVDDVEPAGAVRLFARLPCVVEPALVVPVQSTAWIAAPEQIGHEVGDGTEPRFRFARGCFGTFAVMDV